MRSRVLKAMLVGSGVSITAASTATAPPNLAEVLARFDRVQGQIQTLSADFTETTRNPLLREAQVAHGHFYLTKPNAVLWEYVAPEEMRFVIANDEYVGYFPTRKRAERRDIHRWSGQLFRFFGLGQGSAELGKFYEIALAGPGNGPPDTYQLILTPKKRRIKKKVDEVRLWVDVDRLLPRQIVYQTKDGSTREIVFTETRVNPSLAASLYQVTIPADFAVTNGFSGLGPSAANR